MRVLVVVQVVQDRVEYQPDGTGEVEETGHPLAGQDRLWIAEIGRDDDRPRVVLEQRPRVHEHERVVVHVHHPGGGIEVLGDLMGVLRRGQAGTEVEELVDALARHVPDGAAKRLAVHHRAPAAIGERRYRLLGDRTVPGEVIFPAQDRVVDPRGARLVDVNLRRPAGGTAERPRRALAAHGTNSPVSGQLKRLARISPILDRRCPVCARTNASRDDR